MTFLVKQKPLLAFSANNDRAFIVENQPVLSAVVEKNKTQKVGPKKRRSKQRKKGSSVKIVKGQISLRVPGYQGFQRLAVSLLLRFIPIKRLRQAAKSALKTSGQRPRKTFRHRKNKNLDTPP